MKKPKLISISGSVHAGKTTVSRLIAVNMPNAFYLDGDLLSAIIHENFPKNATIDDILPEVHKEIIKFIKVGLTLGVDCIVDYVFTDEVRQQIVDSLDGIKFQAKWYLLKPDIEKILIGSKNRPKLNKWEIDRIHYHYNGPVLKTKMAKIINSTNQPPEETIKEIMEDL
jgi:hypothetical protein